MDDKTFNQAKRPLNIAYRDVFHDIPCIQDYSCSREEYLSAMKKSIDVFLLDVLLQTTID